MHASETAGSMALDYANIVMPDKDSVVGSETASPQLLGPI